MLLVSSYWLKWFSLCAVQYFNHFCPLWFYVSKPRRLAHNMIIHFKFHAVISVVSPSFKCSELETLVDVFSTELCIVKTRHTAA